MASLKFAKQMYLRRMLFKIPWAIWAQMRMRDLFNQGHYWLIEYGLMSMKPSKEVPLYISNGCMANFRLILTLICDVVSDLDTKYDMYIVISQWSRAICSPSMAGGCPWRDLAQWVEEQRLLSTVASLPINLRCHPYNIDSDSNSKSFYLRGKHLKKIEHWKTPYSRPNCDLK